MVTTTYQVLINNYKEMPPNYTVVEILMNMVLFSLVFQMSVDSPLLTVFQTLYVHTQWWELGVQNLAIVWPFWAPLPRAVSLLCYFFSWRPRME